MPPALATSPRTRFTRTVKTYTWIHPVLILGFTFGPLLQTWHSRDWRVEPISVLGVLVLALLVLPALQSAASALIGLSLPLRRGDRLEDAPDIRPLRRLYICVVSKGANRDALRRTYETLRPLVDDQIRLDILTDLPIDIPHIRVPADFSPEHARYKARALEYYRQRMNFGPGDWVLHLDEETVIDAECLEACIRFCRRSPHRIGQGIIYYNNHGFWRHRLTAVADAVRTGDDLGRLFAQFSWIQRPVFGVHGSFLLVEGALENEITWDLASCLVEDYAFSLRAMHRGYGCGFIDGYAREQSPMTLVDFLKQRRRWVVGIRSLSSDSLWPLYWTTLWQMAPFARVVAIVATVTNFFPWWFEIPAHFACVTYLYLYLLGMLVQDIDYGSKPLTIAWHLIQVAILFPIAMLMETAGVAWAMFTRQRDLTFQVVRK